MSALDVIVGCVALGAAIGTGRAVAPPGAGGWRTLFAVGAGAAAAVAVMAIAAEWLRQPHDPWNAARLAPALSQLHGYKLYYPLDDGPVLSTVVGPVAFLVYWPLGFIFERPTSLILAGTGLNIAAWLVLAVMLVRRVAVGRVPAVLAGLALVHAVLLQPSLRYSLFCIHSDAPALLFGALGAGLVVFGRSPLSWRRCAAAGLAIALAVWAKQSLAPLFLLVAAIVLLHHGRAAAGRFVIAALVVGLAVSVALVASFGFATLRDNMFVVPAAHPWQQIDPATGQTYPHVPAAGLGARVKVLAAAMLHLVRAHWPIYALLFTVALTPALRRVPGQPWWPRKAWSAFFLLALGLMPSAALGRVKVGGEFNHDSLVVLFLVVALVCWLTPQDNARDSRPRWLPLGVTLAVLLLVNTPRALAYGGGAAAWNNQNEVAFEYERQHPGRVYFPWNPLTSLLAHGRLHHFDYGVFDRNLGGARVSPEHLRAHLPAPEPLIASYIAHHDHILRTYFPHYRELAPDRLLPGWHLYGPPEPAGTR